MAHDFDLIVIGGGSGGLAGAFRAAEYGARVALLEPDALGGTCVNAGCVPKKAMWLAAELAGRLRQAGTLGFATTGGALDWPAFIAHRQRYVENIHASYRRRLDGAGITVLPVRGQFVAPDCVEGDDGVRISAPHILIATGGRPFVPPLPGAELGGTSDDFFRWTQPPERVAVVGGGYIAVELAGVLQMLGCRVDLLVRGPRLLDHFDVELATQLAEDYRHLGIQLHFDTQVQALEQAKGGVRTVTSPALDRAVFDRVLFATGRRPNAAGLGLEQAGLQVNARGQIPVDAGHRTVVPGVYAVGDVTPDIALTPVAIATARRLMDRVFGAREVPPLALDLVPTVVFSHPPLGTIGLTEAQARAQFGDDVHVARAGFRPMLHALADSPLRSLFKLVCVGAERRVVGLHLLGEGADEILQGFAVAIRKGVTLDDLRDTVAIHPTSAEEIVLMR
ncbi:glutathione-disulfide reductase [Cognatilysobacter bugurensis]|uniref:Glutathione-disulfide reductase n=1 Tax=Cognatilysobacter bugurensis TaxID=543356 RepID=A0A918STS2_9GAMM|nr:glutathione-disulfide reductase [Lysobacter bugurensis]GHA68858.1 glutathione-disulfide reductase [Lysobacter bugurensis]